MLLTNDRLTPSRNAFQWAPTLGGECYSLVGQTPVSRCCPPSFNGHPPLGVNATQRPAVPDTRATPCSFNGHPPLGVNATGDSGGRRTALSARGFNGHPLLGVNATGFDRKTAEFILMMLFQWAPTLGGECYKSHRAALHQHQV